MKNELSNNYLLAIETTSGAGSISILKDGFEVAYVIGKNGISKSVEVLDNIGKLLEEHKIEKFNLRRIAVSNGPGSLTGLRIGFSLTKGLSDALNIKYQKISILDALVWQENVFGYIITATDVGNEICFREFKKEGIKKKISLNKEIKRCQITEFFNVIDEKSKKEIISVVVTQDLVKKLEAFNYRDRINKNINLKFAEFNLAKLVGLEGFRQERNGDID